MPWWGKSDDKDKNDNNNNDNNASDDENTSGCDYCSNGLACPYLYQDSDGNWSHDRSGAAGYVDNVVLGDSYGIDSNLPSTPLPDDDEDDDKKKKKWRLW